MRNEEGVFDQGVDAIVLVFDVTSTYSFSELDELYANAARRVSEDASVDVPAPDCNHAVTVAVVVVVVVVAVVVAVVVFSICGTAHTTALCCWWATNAISHNSVRYVPV